MRGCAVAPGSSRAGLDARQRLPLCRVSACSSRQPRSRPQRGRASNSIRPMAVFSRYDPFGIWPPYRASSSGSNGGSNGGWGGSSGASSKMSGEQRLTAATPAQRQAMLSNAISGVTDWQQLWSIVERYGRYLSANNVTHALTRLEQVVRGQQFLPAEAAQVQDLLEWLLQRGRELNATAQLGPQGLGATAGAVSRLQQAQRQQLQQQQALRQQQQQQQALRQLQQQEAEAAARTLRQQQAAAVERDQLMRELVDAAVSQKHRLSPQALNNLLSALAEIEESDMSAEEIRKLLHVPNKSQPGAANKLKQVQGLQQQQQQQMAGQQQQMARQQQQQRQQQDNTHGSSSSSSSRPMSPDSLQATARQLGQLSPDLAQEWYDRALRQGLEQGYLPRGIDQSYISGFLARELTQAAARAADSSSSSSSVTAPSGAVLLSKVVSKYSQLMGVDHLALAVHKLAELQEHGTAGTSEEVKAAAGSFFHLLLPLVNDAEAATLSSIINSSKDLQLYSKTLVQACLARAKGLLEQQLKGFVDEEAGFSGRRLGVLLHGLAALGLRPSEEFLRLAVTVAGTLLPSCSLTDLERLASTLIIMRVNPGPTWTTAAEDRLEQLAAALGSSDSRRLRNAGHQDESTDEDEEGTGNARRAIVSCVKALALLGGKRATAWHQGILAAEEEQQQLEQQEPSQQKEGDEDVREPRLREFQQQAALSATQQQQQQQQQQQAQGSQQHVEQQLKKAVQQQQHKAAKMHLHPRHHLQHRHTKQQQQQEGAAVKGQTAPLDSLDDYMDQELQQQQQQQQQVSKLPTADTSLSVPDSSKPTDAGTAAGSDAPAGANPIEAPAPAAWAAEQSTRWAQTRGEAAQPSPTAEVQQRLDDSQKLFGSSAASRRGKAGSSGSSGVGGKQQGGDAGQQGPQQQQGRSSSSSSSGAGGGGGDRGLQGKASPSPASDQSREIPVTFAGKEASKPGAKGGSSSRAAEQGKPSQEAQRSAAEAADALAALMAEIEGEDVAESDQEEVLKELGLSGEDANLAEARVQTAELQEAADMVQHATEQLDNLQKQQDNKAAAAAAAAAGQEDASSKGKGKQRQHKQHTKQQHKQQEQQPTGSRPSAASSTSTSTTGGSSSRILPKEPQRPPLGHSGEAAFVAAAKALKGPKRPSRTLLLGCLEAIEQQQEQLRTQLAKKALQQAVAGAAAKQQAAAKDPVARKLQQLQADFSRARERAEQEKSGIRAAASADVLSRLLPLLDSFEAAEAALDKQQQSGGAGSEREYEEARRVYNALHAQALSIVKSQGVRIVGADGSLVGKPFDPEEMEAVMRQPAPAGFTDGDVLSVLRKGYAVGDKLVRPALVVVAYED